jgi:hypothetical protein
MSAAGKASNQVAAQGASVFLGYTSNSAAEQSFDSANLFQDAAAQ